ncbi:MAG: polyphosphate kinase 2 family protein [Planctomycetia bacterium]|nr:polyphosphate kinase 2 family protein [Planctomycetia bacterium]
MLKLIDDSIDRCRVYGDNKVSLKDFSTTSNLSAKYPADEERTLAEQVLQECVVELADAQDRLYAADSWSLLVIFQAMDAAGKDGTIKHVMSGINPQGCQVHSFKKPSEEELDHDFLWRCVKALPERGRIGIFNRSYYEEVLVVKVHPELLKYQRLPDARPTKEFWSGRYKDIRKFEKHLERNGTRVVKIFLNVSKDEQKRRFLERINDPKKQWKFSAGDVKERQSWDAYMQAYEDLLNSTSSKEAPWYVVPADQKWLCRAIVSRILVQTVDSLNANYPKASEEQLASLEDCRSMLVAEES